MVLDSDTQRNLELTKSMRDRTETGTLVDVIDNTITSMGGRKLRQWMMQPLLEVDLINSRLNAVEELEAQIDLQEELRDKLNQIYDIERLITRINLDVSNAREVLSLKNSLRMISPIQHRQQRVNLVFAEKARRAKLQPKALRSEILTKPDWRPAVNPYSSFRRNNP